MSYIMTGISPSREYENIKSLSVHRAHLIEPELMNSVPSTALNTLNENNEQDENDTNSVVSAPLFLGLCFPPAKSCCCGCSLQYAIRAFSILYTVFGILGTVDSLSNVGLASISWLIPALIRSISNFLTGVMLWATSSTFNSQYCKYAVVCIILSFLTTGCMSLHYIYFLMLTTVKYNSTQTRHLVYNYTRDALIQQYVAEYEKQTHTIITPDEYDKLVSAASFVITAKIISSAISLAIDFLFNSSVLYFLWSFHIRVKQNEMRLLVLGPHNSNHSNIEINPHYAASYAYPYVDNFPSACPQFHSLTNSQRRPVIDKYLNLQPQLPIPAVEMSETTRPPPM